mmetsp:Transcript_84321/g.140951  ORF Transcript_84321/g.140951 Transcript_84321/m.140951 type:complete len:294 (-) Transcript_84321:244-1125(-)
MDCVRPVLTDPWGLSPSLRPRESTMHAEAPSVAFVHAGVHRRRRRTPAACLPVAHGSPATCALCMRHAQTSPSAKRVKVESFWQADPVQKLFVLTWLHHGRWTVSCLEHCGMAPLSGGLRRQTLSDMHLYLCWSRIPAALIFMGRQFASAAVRFLTGLPGFRFVFGLPTTYHMKRGAPPTGRHQLRGTVLWWLAVCAAVVRGMAGTLISCFGGQLPLLGLQPLGFWGWARLLHCRSLPGGQGTLRTVKMYHPGPTPPPPPRFQFNRKNEDAECLADASVSSSSGFSSTGSSSG